MKFFKLFHVPNNLINFVELTAVSVKMVVKKFGLL